MNQGEHVQSWHQVSLTPAILSAAQKCSRNVECTESEVISSRQLCRHNTQYGFYIYPEYFHSRACQRQKLKIYIFYVLLNDFPEPWYSFKENSCYYHYDELCTFLSWSPFITCQMFQTKHFSAVKWLSSGEVWADVTEGKILDILDPSENIKLYKHQTPSTEQNILSVCLLHS